MKIRNVRLADAGAIAEIYAPIVRNTAISFETEPPDASEMALRIEKTVSQFPWLVAEDGGKIAGYAYAGRHRRRAAYQWSCDVSVYVDRSAQRSGIGRNLYCRLLQILMEKGFANAFAGITLPNAASVGLHEALGFEPVGVYRNVGFKMGKWHDVGWWGRPLGDFETPPPPPKVF